MLRSLALPLVLLALLADPRAQCLTLGLGCSGVYKIACNIGAPPKIGTTWLIDATQACAPSNNVMFFGTCQAGAFSFGTPLACQNCPTCKLDLGTVPVTVMWPGIFSLGIPIPLNRALVGIVLCVQNVCAFPTPCVCLSNSLQVTIQM